jgi:hypothetical protein
MLWRATPNKCFALAQPDASHEAISHRQSSQYWMAEKADRTNDIAPPMACSLLMLDDIFPNLAIPTHT